MLRAGSPDFLEHVASVVPHLARRDVEREKHVAAGLVAGVRDRLEYQVERLAVRFQARSEPSLVADARGESALLERGAQRVKNFCARPQGFGKRRRANRHHHELLHVDVRIGVSAAVEDVHHRHRQEAVAAALREVGPERLLRFGCRGMGGGHRHAEDGIRAEPAFRRSAVEIDHLPVERPLVELDACDGFCDFAVDVRDRLRHTFAEVALLVAVAQLQRLALACRRAGGHRRAAESAAREGDVDFAQWGFHENPEFLFRARWRFSKFISRRLRLRCGAPLR